MTEKEELISAAAIRVFSRYGVKRATMNDVADEAGVVRQTLYNVFANKNEVIDGAVRYYMRQTRMQTLAEWADVESLGEKLDILFTNTVIAPWDVIRATPDAVDLEAGTHGATTAALKDSEDQMQRMLVDVFEPYADALMPMGQSAETLATYVTRVMLGLKHGTHERGELLAMLETLKTSILVMVSEDLPV